MKVVKVTPNIVTEGDPNIQHDFVGKVVGDKRSTFINQLVSKGGK